jgi:hypothetical protein
LRKQSAYSLSFEDKIRTTIAEISDVDNDLFFLTLNSANSEGVQNWTYGLVNNGELKQTYGLTYLQSIVNTAILRPFQGELVNYQAAYYFKRVAYPELTNHGYDFSFTAEGILNWHNFAFVSYLLLGGFIGYLHKHKFDSALCNALYYFVLAIIFVNLRTDSTSFFRLLSFIIISFWVFKKMNLVNPIISKTNDQI